MRRQAVILPCVAVVAVASLAPGARAQAPRRATEPQERAERQEQPERAALKQWFAELDDADAPVREAARRNLMGMRREDLAAFRDIVRESLPLMPSQAAVLRQIVTHVFLAGEPYFTTRTEGFLGVKMQETSVRLPAADGAEQFAPAVGVVIVERMPGFVGARMLLDGDVVLGVVERPDVRTLGMYEFQMVVKGVSPGTVIHFQVMRQGQVVRVPIAPDPRPVDADVNMQNLTYTRQRSADEFWEKIFSPVVKDGVG